MCRLGLAELGLQDEGVGNRDAFAARKSGNDLDRAVVRATSRDFPGLEAAVAAHEHDLLAFHDLQCRLRDHDADALLLERNFGSHKGPGSPGTLWIVEGGDHARAAGVLVEQGADEHDLRLQPRSRCAGEEGHPLALAQ